MSDLPLDLVEELLSRVPATSLKRLRSTCKKWNALLNNRRFTEKHFREASKQSHALLWKDFRVCPMRINLNVAAPSIEFKSVLIALNYYLLESENGVSLKGNTYWFALDDDTSFLLGFDFTTERFNRFSLPSTENLDMMVLSVFREEKLSMSHEKFCTSKMDIWIPNRIDSEAALSWKKSFSIEFKILSICHYFPFCNSFMIDKEKKVVVCTATTLVRDKNMVSIIGEDNAYYTEIPVESTNCSCSPYIFNYVPSLVQIQQCRDKIEE
ncbi:unnamed protein product [Arabidopsis lyrata]|uniref:F-box domain-containing protein n=1 Tax=Arabidopsis lyrata subsp. lyrata TaxID=81972 RepID=D7L8K4_ARALL|nr:hypothetical protein ARALYDRAFT_899303 [Arabidopsis lyrata subsp. lyrata]CAH8261948.1 unnamed protein product [Arabidopsis lyrata]